MMNKVYTAVGGSVITSVVLVIPMVISLLLSWFTGEVFKWIAGNLIVRGVLTMFPHMTFQRSDIPAVWVVLSLIASVFYAASVRRSRED